jgi:protein O-GlcNAc transferase
MNAQEIIDAALVRHRDGALDDAVTLYRQALEISGGHPAAANLLAVALDEQGKGDDARAILGEALDGVPREESEGFEPALNLARLFLRDGDFDAAIDPLSRAATLEPRSRAGETEARGLLFQVALRLGRVDLAETAASALLADTNGTQLCARAIDMAAKDAPAIARAMVALAVLEKPLEPAFLVLYGNILSDTENGGGTGHWFRRALVIAPGFAVAENNLANILAVSSDPEPSRRRYRHAVVSGAPFADAEANLARLLTGQGDVLAAERHARRAIEIDPAGAGHREAMGLLALAKGDFPNAIRHFTCAVLLDPGHPSVWSNLGGAIKPSGDAARTLAALRRAVTVAPALVEAHRNIGVQRADLADMAGARSAYQAALALTPEDTGLAFKAAMTFNTLPADDDEIDAIRAAIAQDLTALRAAGGEIGDPMAEVGLPNFYLAYHGRNDRDIQTLIAQTYLALCPGLAWTAPHCGTVPDAKSDGKIKIGFFSVFLHEHSIRYIAEGVIQTLDRDLFEVTVFGTQAEADISVFGDASTTSQYVRIPNRLEPARGIIAEAGLDILVYCDIGMEPLSYYLGFARLAPVQCVLQGHPVTTGIPNIDYFISSAWQEPEDYRDHYTEACVRLSDIAFHYLQEPTAMPGTRAGFTLPDDKRLYFCPQTLFKFHPDFDAMLAGILRRDPDGLVLLLRDRSGYRSWQLRDRLNAALGEDARRVVWLDRMPRERFYTLMTLSDVILDTPYFSGGNTTIQSLALGLPTVTFASPHVRGRITMGWMRILETMDLIAGDADAYADIAVSVARDKAFRESVLTRLRVNAPKLFRRDGVTREHERFFIAALAAAEAGRAKLDWGPKGSAA